MSDVLITPGSGRVLFVDSGDTQGMALVGATANQLKFLGDLAGTQSPPATLLMTVQDDSVGNEVLLPGSSGYSLGSPSLPWKLNATQGLFSPSSGSPNINFGDAGVVSSPSDGDFWYDSSAGELNFRADTTTVDILSLPSGSGTAGEVAYWSGTSTLTGASTFTFSSGQLSLSTTGSGGGLVIGGDANLYRSAADVLKTDDSLVVGANLTVSSLTSGRVTFAGTSGLLSDNALFTYDGTTLAVGVLDAMIVNGVTQVATLTLDSNTRAQAEVHTHTSVAADGSCVYGARSRGTAGAKSAVQNGDELFKLCALGFDGTDYAVGGQIRFVVSASPGSDDMPGSIILATTADGASTPTDRLTISHTGGVSVASLTSGRVVFSGTSGLLSDAATFTFASGQLSLSTTGSGGGLVIGGDTNLYRSAADVLKTDDSFVVGGSITVTGLTAGSLPYVSTAGLLATSTEMQSDGASITLTGLLTNSFVFSVMAPGDTFSRLRARADGLVVFGSGSGTPDTNLFRSAADVLATDDSFVVGVNLTVTSLTAGRVPFASTAGLIVDSSTFTFASGQLSLSTTGIGGGVLLGGDAQLYRSAADVLRTPDSVVVDANLTVASLTSGRVPFASTGGLFVDASTFTFASGQLSLSTTGSGGGLVLGADANLYRSAADVLKTDDSLVVGVNLTVTSLTSGRVPFASTAGLLVDASTFTFASGQLSLSTTGSGGGLVIGGDTNLYRSAADVLKTDDSFVVGGSITVTGLTAGRVVYASTAGLLAGSANWTFNGTSTQFQMAALAATVVYATAVALDGADRFEVSADGTLTWGDGTFALDTNLYRSAANILKTDDSLIVSGGLTVSTLTAGRVPFASTAGLLTDSSTFTFASGQLALSTTGSGGGVVLGGDTNLYRSAADVLKTDDSLVVGVNLTVSSLTTTRVPFASTAGLLVDSSTFTFASGQLSLSTAGSGGGLVLGGDVNLYRSAADVLKTDDSLVVGVNLTVSSLTTTRVPFASTAGLLVDAATFTFASGQLSLSTTGSGGGVVLGGDANLYRSAADVLKTDDSLVVGVNLTVTSLTTTRVPFASTAGLLVDSSTFTFASGQLSLSTTGSGGGVVLGGDANLYRSAADVLKTDDSFVVGVNLTVSSLTTTRVPFASTAGLLIDSASLTYTTGSGQLAVATTGSGAGILIGGDVQIYRSAADNLLVPDNVQFSSPSNTSTSGNKYSLLTSHSAAPSADTSGRSFGLSFGVTSTTAFNYTDSTGGLTGFEGAIHHNGSGTLTAACCGIFSGDTSTTGTITTLNQVYILGMDVSSGATIGTFNGLRIDGPRASGAGTVTAANWILLQPRTYSAATLGSVTGLAVFPSNNMNGFSANNQTRLGIDIGAMPDPASFPTGAVVAALRFSTSARVARNGLQWGTDTLTNLYSSASNVLKTDGSLVVATNLTVSTLTSGRVTFATTSGQLTDASTFTFASGQLSLSTTGSGGGLVLGGDANLYRSAADALKTDDEFVAGKRMTSAVSALTDAATITVDASLGNHFRVTLGGNRTLGNPSNGVDGQKITFELIQDGTGTRTLALDTKYALGTDITAVTLTTTLNKRDFLGVVYNSTADKWYVVSFVKGY